MIDTGAKQYHRRLRAVHNGKEYVYYVAYRGPKSPDSSGQISPNMTETEVRELAAAGEWREVSDIDRALRDAREAADLRRRK